MKKLTLLITLLFALSVSARTLSPAEALQRAISGPMQAPSINGQQPRLISTGYYGQNQPVYYIFESAADEGFMIVSADDIAIPLLGYSATGTVDINDIPDNMKDWLQCYAEEIAAAANREARGELILAPASTSSSRLEKAPIEPLCATKWNQSEPYNLQAPTITVSGSTQHCATGCVATAMAQLMKYHNYPAVGKGSNSFSWTRPDTNQSTTLSINFSSTPLDWDNMLNVYSTGYYNDSQADAVATLMKACGYSVDMGYGQSSGAVTAYVADALKNYFDYSPATRFEYRDSYGYYDWVDKIYDNLANVGPLVFSGHNDDGGHAFIIDGYNGNGYFHTNWGWGGLSDGYFLISALDPDAQGIGGSSAGYNQSQGAIFNARPAKEGETYENVFKLNVTQEMTATISGNSITVEGKFVNSGDDSPSTVYVGGIFADYDTDENCVSVQTTYVNSWPSRSYLSKLTYTFPTSLKAGIYKLYPSYTLTSGKNMQRASSAPGIRNYVVIKKDDDGTLSLETQDRISLYIDDMTLTTNVYKGHSFKVTATAQNDTDTDVIQEVRLCFVSNNSIVAYCPTIMVDIPARETSTLSNTYTISAGSVTAGETYQLCFVDMNTYFIVSNIVDVTVQTDPGAPVLALNHFSINNPETMVLDDFRINYSVTCRSGLFSKPIYVLIFNENLSGTNIASATTQSHFIQTGETASANGHKITRLSNLEIGRRYAAALFYNNGSNLKQLSNPLYFTVSDIVTGIDDVIADNDPLDVDYSFDGETLVLLTDSEVRSVEVYDISGRKVATSDNAVVNLNGVVGGIYIVRVATANGFATLKIIK